MAPSFGYVFRSSVHVAETNFSLKNKVFEPPAFAPRSHMIWTLSKNLLMRSLSRYPSPKDLASRYKSTMQQFRQPVSSSGLSELWCTGGYDGLTELVANCHLDVAVGVQQYLTSFVPSNYEKLCERFGTSSTVKRWKHQHPTVCGAMFSVMSVDSVFSPDGYLAAYSLLNHYTPVLLPEGDAAPRLESRCCLRHR